MKLALCFGKTLSELDQVLSAGELYLWAAYDKTYPIGYERFDIHAAQVSTAILQSQGAKVSINDMLIKWDSAQKESNSDQVSSGHIFFKQIIKAQKANGK